MTVLDGNGQIFPLAVAVAEGENEDSWMWFLALVCSALNIDIDNGGAGMVVLSDREKGLANAVRTLLPRAAHSPCVFHIQKTSRDSRQPSMVSFSRQRRRPTTMHLWMQWPRCGCCTGQRPITSGQRTRRDGLGRSSNRGGSDMSRLTCPNK